MKKKFFWTDSSLHVCVCVCVCVCVSRLVEELCVLDNMISQGPVCVVVSFIFIFIQIQVYF